MDPFSITASTLQVVAYCAVCTVNIIKWVGDVRGADSRIRGFYDEVIALQSTYEGLEKSLNSPIMIEAARVASSTSDGAHLWSQIKVALDDSTKTMIRVNEILDKIKANAGIGRKVKMQLQESLTNGEMCRLRQRIQFFNATISLPIQMVCVMLQLEQRGMSVEHQRQLDQKFMSLERTMRELIDRLSRPGRTGTMMTGSTLIVGAADDDNNSIDVDIKEKENYLSFARKILSSASAAASTRSSLSTVTPQIEPSPLIDLGLAVHTPSQLPIDRRRTIPDWIPAPSTTDLLLSDTYSASGLSPAIQPDHQQVRGRTYEVDYKLAERHLTLAQTKAEQGNHESAEKSFKKALTLLGQHDFSGRMAFQPAEVVLMLAQTCSKQQKYDEAINLLQPVAERQTDIFPQSAGGGESAVSGPSCSSPPDKLQALAASHLLGEVYLLKGDHDNAQAHAEVAFLERTTELGEHDEKTLDSVRLLIDIFRAMGDTEEAEAYEVFLVPSTPQQTTSQNDASPRVDRDFEQARPASQVSPPPSEIMSPPLAIRQARPSITTRIRNPFHRHSNTGLTQVQTTSTDQHRLSVSRRGTIADPTADVGFLSTDRRGFSSPSEASTHDRTGSYYEEGSTAPSSTKLERSPSIKRLEPTFLAIEQLCDDRKYDKAVKLAMSFLQGYNSDVFIIRRDELEKNIRKGIGKGLSSTGKGYSPLHFFTEMRTEYAEEVSLILKYGADVNAVAYKAGFTAANSKTQFTPLQLALDRGHSNITAMLLRSPTIRTDFKDIDGLTPFLSAIRRQNHAIVTQLLALGPSVLPADYPTSAWHGNTALHDAARHCDATTVEMLLGQPWSGGSNAILNAQDRFGKTALIHAVVKSDISNPLTKQRMLAARPRVVTLLLAAGADLTITDQTGRSARDYALLEGEDESQQRELLAVLEGARHEMMA